MEDYERELLVSRIMAGYVRCEVGDNTILVHDPTIHTIYQANEVYASTYRTCNTNGSMSPEEAVQMVRDTGDWSDEDEEYFSHGLPDQIDYFKVELYQALFKSEERKRLRKYLEVAREKYEEMNATRNKYYEHTPAGIASYAKNIYVLENSSTYIDGTPCNWEDISLTTLMREYAQHMIDDTSIRELAKTDPWMGTWQSHKVGSNIFNNYPLSDTQKRLIGWTLMYDNIHESPEKPPTKVIQDNDMLDGWLIIQKRKRQEEEDKNAVEGGLAEKIANSGEVYIKVDNIKDARKVNQANDPRIRAMKKSRFEKIKQSDDKISQLAFDDVRMDIMMQANQQGITAQKGR